MPITNIYTNDGPTQRYKIWPKVLTTLPLCPLLSPLRMTHLLHLLLKLLVPCTINTWLSSTAMTDTIILSIAIWNQLANSKVYHILHQPNTCHQKPPSTAVKYALLGIHNKLFYPPTFFCLLSTFNYIVCCSVVLSCFGLSTNLFILVKIDDQHPNEWNE